jgi:hypothetical protein
MAARAARKFAANPQRESRDPRIPPSVADPVVYLRYWQEGWADGR